MAELYTCYIFSYNFFLIVKNGLTKSALGAFIKGNNTFTFISTVFRVITLTLS